MQVQIGVSAHHLHVTKETFYRLFGEEILEVEKEIHQPGQFASTKTVTLKTDKAEIKNVRILGPFRPYNQVEISVTEAYQLGLHPPVRMSGDIKGSSPITIVGPKGEVSLEEGCIIADRHIHLLPEQASSYGLEGLEEVDVLLPGEKGGIIHHVQLRVDKLSYFEMHLDTDDANAHLVKSGDLAEIIIPK